MQEFPRAQLLPDGSSPKEWQEFISEAAELIEDESEREIIRNFIRERKYLLALQAIFSEVDPIEILTGHLEPVDYMKLFSN